jgi:hypothetical protein
MRNTLQEIPEFAFYGNFKTGDTVTIEVFEYPSLTNVTVLSNACTEIGTSGFFYWALSNIVNPVTDLSAYLFCMTNQIGDEQKGVEHFGGWPNIAIAENVVTNGDMCKVYADIFEPTDESGIMPAKMFAEESPTYAQIVGTYYQESSNKFFSNSKILPSGYDIETGRGFFLLPQGATVKVFIKQISVNQNILIPLQDSANLNDLLI